VYTPVKVPCEAEFSTFLVAFELNIEQRNTTMIIPPKSLQGHILLGAPSSVTPKDQTQSSNRTAGVENTIGNRGEEKNCFLAPGTPAVTTVASCSLVTGGFFP
jgi:hypothetical protein